ncbi:MAG TPA: pilus assembly protein PilM [Candidatus Paceibacterota bacterium]|nr:pilus assembly protein PilM [Candidatus Paceibacterota bacterium]
MQRAGPSGSAGKRGGLFSRMFPAPNFLSPRCAGIDISDASIKWIALSRPGRGSRKVEAWGQEPLPGGIVSAGVIQDPARLTEALRAIKRKMPRVTAVHAALPEESAFVFSLSAPAGSSREQILSMIEFEFEARVPIPPTAAVYDFDLIPGQEGDAQEIGVVVFPRELAESYADSFADAGFSLLSLEIEARSIARAAVPRMSPGNIALLVDFGFKRTGFAVLKSGIPIFTSTVEIGGEAVDRALKEKMHLSQEQVQLWKNEQGLLPEGGVKSPGLEAVSGAASALGSEVARHFNYWDTRRNDRGERVSPVSHVLLLGGSANMKGLADYIAGRVQAPVERPNVWNNVCSFDEYIPPIERRNSLQYATAIGLALRD